jgi:hypothetical protein
MPRTLKMLVTQLQQRYDGEYAPNIEAVWDETEVDQNPEGWGDVVTKAQKAVAGGEYENVAVLTVTVPDSLYAAPETPSPAALGCLESKPGQYGLRLIVAEQTDGSEKWTQIVDAWDSYVIEENSEGFQEKLDAAKAKVGTDYTWVKVVDLYLQESIIAEALAPWARVHSAALIDAPTAA